MAYCGCATLSNKIKWAIFGVFLVILIVFLVAYIAVLVQAAKEYNNCLEPFEGAKGTLVNYIYEARKNYCEDEIKNDYGAKYTAFLVIFIIALIVCTIPLYVMCCCTNPPNVTTYTTGTPVAFYPNK